MAIEKQNMKSDEQSKNEGGFFSRFMKEIKDRFKNVIDYVFLKNSFKQNNN